MIRNPENPFRVPKCNIPQFAAAVFVLTFAVSVLGQTNDARGKNNPFSPSPPRRAKQVEPLPTPLNAGSREVSFVMQAQSSQPKPEERPTVAQTTSKIAKNADLRNMSPTEIYRIGVGDVLLITLKNAPKGSGYYTVRSDGTIDFPLAGENVIVAGQTADNAGEILASGIKLFQNPEVEVRVREYASHKVTVSGMVERPGEKNLQREAVPLFVIRAEAGVDARATKVLVTRTPQTPRETHVLSDGKTDNVLIYPGNTVEFTSESGNLRGSTFYFISGAVNSVGQRDLTVGLTLYQAVIASGGPKGDPKKATIRRKNNAGVLVSTEHNLRNIKAGKARDVLLSPGDVIEIRN